MFVEEYIKREKSKGQCWGTLAFKRWTESPEKGTEKLSEQEKESQGHRSQGRRELQRYVR